MGKVVALIQQQFLNQKKSVCCYCSKKTYTESNSTTRKKVPRAQLMHEEQQQTLAIFRSGKTLSKFIALAAPHLFALNARKKKKTNFMSHQHTLHLFSLVYFDVGVFCRLRSSVYSR